MCHIKPYHLNSSFVLYIYHNVVLMAQLCDCVQLQLQPVTR
jgi:hypothetical protein